MKHLKLIKAAVLSTFILASAPHAFAASTDGLIIGEKYQTNEQGQRVNTAGGIMGDRKEVNNSGQYVNTAGGIVGDRKEVNDSGQYVNTAGGKKIELDDIAGHWAEKYIKELIAKGILEGDENHHFKPESHVTREEFTAMVARMFNLKNASATQDFKDVPPTRWSFNFVEATKAYFDSFVDINGGLDFHPAQGAKREDVTVTLVKILMKETPSLQLLDAAAADQLLHTQFTDADNISAALRPYVATAVQSKIIQGDGQGHFNPQNTLSRAEAATLLDRLQNAGVVVDPGTVPGNPDHAAMLMQIKELAKQGKVPGSEFVVGTTLIDEVHQKWGTADTTNQEGEYSESYSRGMGSGSFTFVVGTGEILSEIRTFGSTVDPAQDITKLTVSEIKQTWGSPDQTKQSDNKETLVYNMGDFQLKIIVAIPDQVNTDPHVENLSIYSPKSDVPMGAR